MKETKTRIYVLLLVVTEIKYNKKKIKTILQVTVNLNHKFKISSFLTEKQKLNSIITLIALHRTEVVFEENHQIQLHLIILNAYLIIVKNNTFLMTLHNFSLPREIQK